MIDATGDLLSEPVARVRVTSADIKGALKQRLPSGEYALFFEVRDAAGLEQGDVTDILAGATRLRDRLTTLLELATTV